MMAYVRRIVLPILCMMLLSGCLPTYETYYEFDDTSKIDVQKCVSYCKIAKEKCTNQCATNGDLCKKSTIHDAKLKNSDYLKDKPMNEAVLVENTTETYNPLQCVSTACDCENDYRACYQMCGGKVDKKERCIAHCPDS